MRRLGLIILAVAVLLGGGAIWGVLNMQGAQRSASSAQVVVAARPIELGRALTPDMLRLCVQGWWASVGNTRASGISKLMMSEGANFPELSDFYRREVMEPGNALIRSILQRGVDRGEFGPIDMKYGVYTVLAPMLFLVMWKHSFASSTPKSLGFVPEEYLSAHIESLLYGLCLPMSDSGKAKLKTVTPKPVF